MDEPESRRVGCYKEKPGSDIIKQGCLKKLKVLESVGHIQTLKKKYFVLRSTSSSGPARLDYYDSEKKFKSSHAPKKSIHLYKCFNINMRTDAKHRFIIVLYLLSSDCFSIVVDSEAEQKDWFNKLLDYQNEYLPDGEQPRIHYEHVWQGTIKQKSAASHLKITGPYRMCLLDKDLVLVHLDSLEPAYTFQLSSIRKCGHSSDYFFIEVGRTTVTGVGELWMQVDDAGTSENMHVTVLESMQLSRMAPSDHFRRRSNTTQSHVSQPDTAIRKRATSESHPQKKSPRGNRASLSRPSSTVVMYARAAPIIVEAPDLSGANTGGAFDHILIDTSRLRTDSIGSKGSHSSYKSEPFESYGSSSAMMTPDGSLATTCEPTFSKVEEQFWNDEEESTDCLPMLPRSSTPSPTRSHCKMGMSSVDSDYLVMTHGNRSMTSSPLLERPGSSGSDSHTSHQRDGYMDMKPTSTNSSPGNSTSYMSMTPPKSASSSSTGLYMNFAKASGYIDMSPGQRTPTDLGTSYIVMDGGRGRTTVPIAIRQKEPAYFEMGPSSQPLPTVKEGGSGEAYLPMSPDRYSLVSSEGLKPAKVVSYLSDDTTSGEFPKRAYSVGSRPKPAMKCYLAHDVLHRQPLDNSMSSSAPHLIVPKTRTQLDPLYRNQQLDSSTGSLSTSVKSDTIDSFMEMEFYRPRTASDSYGCHPRTSSFGKQCQGHRPRSSSYGHSSKLNMSKLAMEYPTESLEFVRGSSSGLSSRRQSQESIGKVSNSSRNSSSDSLKRISEDYQNTKIPGMPEYMDMGFDKHGVASSSIHSIIPKTDPSAYIDMKLGTSASKSSSQCVSPSSSVHSLASSPVSAIHNFDKSSSFKVVKPSGNTVLKQSFKPQSTAPLVSEIHLKVSASDLQKFEKRSPSSSGKESEDESYVPFHPRFNSTGKAQDPGHELPYNVQRSNPGLTCPRGCSESCDSPIKSPEILLNADKLLRLKKDEPRKTKLEDEHIYGNNVNKREKDKFDSEKQNLAKSNLNDYCWENVESWETGPTLDGIEFIPDNDLFSNKRFSNIPSGDISLQRCANQLPRHKVSKPNDSACLNYIPGFDESPPLVSNMNSNIRNEIKENCLAKAVHHTVRSEHKAEREYCEIDLPHEQAQKSEKECNATKVSTDYMLADPAPDANVEKLFGDKKLNEKFSYMDFDPATEKSIVIDEVENTPLKSPLKVISFITHSDVSVQHAKNTTTDVNLETCVDSQNKDNYCPEIGGVKDANQETVQQSKSCFTGPVKEDSSDEMSKHNPENSYIIDHDWNKCHGEVNDNKSNNARNDSEFDFERRESQLNSGESCSRRRHSLKGRGKTAEECLVLSDNGSAVEGTERKDKDPLISDHKALSKLLIKQTHFVRTNIEPDQDEGYVELDFSDKRKLEKSEKEGSNVRQIRLLNIAKVETEGVNMGCRVRMKGTGKNETDESTGDINRKCLEDITGDEELPCPETPKCYISDDNNIPTPETPISYILDDSSISGTSVSTRELGMPPKQPLAGRNSMPATVKGQGSGEGSRKTLPPTKNTTQCSRGSVSHQTSISSAASSATPSSPRTNVEIQVIHPRCRKTSGPASFSSSAKSDNAGNSQNLEPLISVQELHKQNSMPCMILPSEKNISSIISEVHSRYSFTDLLTYEEIAAGTHLGNEHTGSQPQLWQNKELHYADLDLGGSSEHMEGISQRNTKIWHPSSLNDLSKAKAPYAEIDYLKTESIKHAPDKEVKFTL